jgi:hypothetical protein
MEIVNQDCERKFIYLSQSFSQLVEVQGPLLLFLDKVLELHCLYGEIFRRFNLIPETDMRTVRKYLGDYYAMIRFAITEIQVLRTGRLFRPYDIANNPIEFVHPTLFGSFPNGIEGSSCKLSTRSVSGFAFLRNELAQSIRQCQFVPNHPQVEFYRGAFKEMDSKCNQISRSFYNWEMDLFDLFDRVQQVLRTKLCMGYHIAANGYYDLQLTPEHWRVYRKYPTLNIPIIKVKFDVKVNAAIIKRNITNCVIMQASGCTMGFGVLNDENFRKRVVDCVQNHMEHISKRRFARSQIKFQDRAARSNTLWRAGYV